MLTEFKDYLTLGTLVFMAGGVLQIVRALQKNFEELKSVVKNIERIANDHETRISIIETAPKTTRKRK